VGDGMWMASTGQTAAQKPHSSQNVSSMCALASMVSMACGGQISEQRPQSVHKSLSISGIIAYFHSEPVSLMNRVVQPPRLAGIADDMDAPFLFGTNPA